MKETIAGNTERYMCFNLGSEEYAVPLLTIREVVALPKVAPIPQAPPYFLGLMNLRGNIIPLVDLRLKMGIQASSKSESVVVILDIETTLIGMMVDSINHVLNAPRDKIAPAPKPDKSGKYNYITGVYRKDTNLVLILDIKNALDSSDHNLISATIPGKAA